jgi:hypothetical protein
MLETSKGMGLPDHTIVKVPPALEAIGDEDTIGAPRLEGFGWPAD